MANTTAPINVANQTRRPKECNKIYAIHTTGINHTISGNTNDAPNKSNVATKALSVGSSSRNALRSNSNNNSIHTTAVCPCQQT